MALTKANLIASKACSYKDSIVHIYYLAAREKSLFYPEEESNPYAFIL